MLLRLRGLQRLVGHACKLLVKNKENQIALVLSIVEQGSQPHVRALGDLAERRCFIAMLGEQLAHRGSNALSRFKLVLFPKTECRRQMRLQGVFSCQIESLSYFVCQARMPMAPEAATKRT